MKCFHFEAAHALGGTALGEISEEVHGHSFRAEVVFRGKPAPDSGMLVDLTVVERELQRVRGRLDHKLLNRVEGLGQPTLENLCRFIWGEVERLGTVVRVSVYRDSCGEGCSYFGERPAGRAE